MPQNDMNIANDSGANVRTDFNNAFSALVQNSSGGTEPATTFAHQLWADTSPTGYTLFQVRDAANAAWSGLFDDEGRWKGADGTAAEPSWTFASDVDTGVYRVGANALGIVTGGTLAFSIDSSQDATFTGDVTISDATLPVLELHETSATADEGRWQFRVGSDTFSLNLLNDAGSSIGAAFAVTRTAHTSTLFQVFTNLIVDNTITAGGTSIQITEATGLLRHQAIDPTIAGTNLGVATGVLSVVDEIETITTDTTPTAVGRKVIVIGTWTAANNITDFDNETAGQRLTILGGDSDCNIVDGAPIQLVGGVTWNGAAGATLELVSSGGIWYELSRSDAS